MQPASPRRFVHGGRSHCPPPQPAPILGARYEGKRTAACSGRRRSTVVTAQKPYDHRSNCPADLMKGSTKGPSTVGGRNRLSDGESMYQRHGRGRDFVHDHRCLLVGLEGRGFLGPHLTTESCGTSSLACLARGVNPFDR